MVLQIPGFTSIFPHNNEFDEGGGRIRRGMATIVVALDGSGDTEDIQEGINMLPAAGGVVYIKEGTYNLTEAVTINKNNVNITGTGKGTHIIANGNFRAFTITTIVDVSIEKLYITGSNNASNVYNDAIRSTTGANGLFIKDCIIEDMGWLGINSSSGDNCFFFNNYIKNCGRYGVSFLGGDNSIISGNYCEACSSGIVLSSCNYVIVSNNICHSSDGTSPNGNGITLGSETNRCIILGNSCYSNNVSGIESVASNSDNNLVIANVCYNNSVSEINIGANSDTLPDGAMGTTNLETDDLNIIT